LNQRIQNFALLGFVGGIAFSSFLFVPIYLSLLLIVLSLFILIYFIFLKRTQSFEDKINYQKVFIICAIIISFNLGLCRVALSPGNDGNELLNSFIGQNIKFDAIIVEEPDLRETSAQLIVSLDKFYKNNEEIAGLDEKVILTVGLYPKFSYGDKIVVEGKLGVPKNFANNNGGRVFDYVSYLAKDGIHYEMYRPFVVFEGKGYGNIVKTKLLQFKGVLTQKIASVIPEPQASLLGGLLIGTKQSLGKDLQEEFRKAGIIHIVVLSGYNITIIAEFIMRIFFFLPQALGISFGSISIILFALMTGASATTIRASIMALLVILARSTGRTYQVTRALFLAGFFMILYNPKILVFDPSFQLSFSATLGLIYVSPIVARYLNFLPQKFQLREFAIATVTTQIFLLPLLLYMTGMLSIVALPVNLLILVFIPVTMFFGFIATIFSFFSFILALPFSLVAYIFLSYELDVVKFFSNLPFSAINVPYFPAWLLVVFYVFYGVVVFKLRKKFSITMEKSKQKTELKNLTSNHSGENINNKSDNLLDF